MDMVAAGVGRDLDDYVAPGMNGGFMGGGAMGSGGMGGGAMSGGGMGGGVTGGRAPPRARDVRFQVRYRIPVHKLFRLWGPLKVRPPNQLCRVFSFCCGRYGTSPPFAGSRSTLNPAQ